MKLATVASIPGDTQAASRDGRLVVCDDHQRRVYPVTEYPTLQSALENWHVAERVLMKAYDHVLSDNPKDVLTFDDVSFRAPLPRSYSFLDGSAFIHHIKLVRKARNAPLPERLHEIPMMYQGCSDQFLGPRDAIPLYDMSHGLDIEGEFAVILDHVPAGTPAEEAVHYVRLLILLNDVSLRGLIPEEVKTGFGFVQSKPPSSCAPFAVTPDVLGDHWHKGRIELPLYCWRNNELIGAPNGKEMHFSFGELIAHACRTRDLTAGTIIGSGTVSNEAPETGVTCIAEQRMLEIINNEKAETPFLHEGDTIAFECFLDQHSIFGRIEQNVISIDLSPTDLTLN